MTREKRNSFYGFLGFIIPTIIVFLAYPLLIERLGAEAFGLFVLATSISGTLAFLDFGFSVSTLKFIAEDVGKGALDSAAEVLAVSLVFYAVLGILGMSVIWVIAGWLADIFTANITTNVNHADVILSFRLASIQFAVFFLTSVFISIFKGLHRFDISSATLSILPLLTYGGAVFGVTVAHVGLVGVTFISLCANVFVLLMAAKMGIELCHKNGILLMRAKLRLKTFKRMFKFGAFMTFNSISSLMLYQIQRYLIGALIGPAAVTVYILAFTVVSKVHGMINSATEFLFPLASSMDDVFRMRKIYIRMLAGSGLVAFVFLFPLAVFPGLLLGLWLNSDLAPQAALLLPFFALAYFFLALSPAPYHIVNGIGKPNVNTAFYIMNALVNLFLIAVFSWTGISLEKFVYAFAIANIITSVAFQSFVESKIWRQDLLAANFHGGGVS